MGSVELEINGFNHILVKENSTFLLRVLLKPPTTDQPTTDSPTHRPLTIYPPTHRPLTHRPTDQLLLT